MNAGFKQLMSEKGCEFSLGDSDRKVSQTQGPPLKGLPDGEEYQLVAPSKGESAPELFIHTFRICKK